MKAPRVVVMGVSGCGKSEVGARLAQALAPAAGGGRRLPSARQHRQDAPGLAAHDADRAGWLQVLGEQLAAHADGAVLTCSALKRAYRERCARRRRACGSCTWR
jgi:gluconokinase